MTVRNLLLIHLLLILTISIFPPYYVIEESNKPEYMHESLGVHPIWEEPTIDVALKAIEVRYAQIIPKERQSNFAIEFNKVQFIIYFTSILLVFIPFYIITFRKAKRTKSNRKKIV